MLSLSYTLYDARKTTTTTPQNAVAQLFSYTAHHYFRCLTAVNKWKLFLHRVNHHVGAVRETLGVVLMQSAEAMVALWQQVT